MGDTYLEFQYSRVEAGRTYLHVKPDWARDTKQNYYLKKQATQQKTSRNNILCFSWNTGKNHQKQAILFWYFFMCDFIKVKLV